MALRAAEGVIVDQIGLDLGLIQHPAAVGAGQELIIQKGQKAAENRGIFGQIHGDNYRPRSAKIPPAMRRTIGEITLECLQGDTAAQKDIEAVVNAANADLLRRRRS